MSIADESTSRLLLDAALALGIGLFVGLEREHSDVSEHPAAGRPVSAPREAALGVRRLRLVGAFWLGGCLLGNLWPGQLAALVASTVMLARVLVVAVVINPRLTQTLALPLGAMMACMALGSFWKWRQLQRAAPESTNAGELELQNPFSLLPALKWGALYAAILLASALAGATFGDYGFVVTAAVSGFVDVDAVTLAASRLAADAELGMALAALAITAAVASNTIAKGALAWAIGGRRFGADIAKVFAAAMAVGLVVALLTALR